jgi:hypothetical protein
MQQPNVSIDHAVPGAGSAAPAAGPDISFVINLCASTTPAGLEQPTDPALQRFKFFVSRRREDGRERFRLHMGYFPSQEAAEQMLAAVRDVYPAAWAGVAPGQKLRARLAAAPPSPPALTEHDVTATGSLSNVRAAIQALDEASDRKSVV